MQTVLVIDDDVVVAEELGRVLSAGGYLPTVKTTSISGLNYAKLCHPSLVISGICLAGMSGYEVADNLRNDPLTEDIPIIFLTGLTDARDTLRGFRVGASAVLHKPASAEDILEVVRQVKRGSPEEKAEDICEALTNPAGLLTATAISLILARVLAIKSPQISLDTPLKFSQLFNIERFNEVINVILSVGLYTFDRLWWLLHGAYVLIPPTFTDVIAHNH